LAAAATGSVADVSPLTSESDLAAPAAPAPAAPAAIISVTDDAMRELVTLREHEPDADRLGLRLEIMSAPGEEFRYDLSFDVVTKAAFSDEIRAHITESAAIKVIIPAKDLDLLQGATLDHTPTQGLVIRNPNKPRAPMMEGLTNDDALSAEIEAVVDSEVNPALAAHGGFVTFAGHDGLGTAYFTMGGGCHGCSMSRMTMLEGVQTMLVEQVPGVERVKDLTDHASGENPFYH
jgi:Fe/S biogenesis protein NfuA